MSESNGTCRGWFIDDGQTYTAPIRGRKGLYPAFMITYRPVLPERLYSYQKADRSLPGRELASDAELIVEHVLAWGLPAWGTPHRADGDVGEGMTVPTVERVKRLHPTIIPQVINTITGHGYELTELAGNSGTGS